MEREQLKFVVVGSVDHGKSTLIGRFLYDTGSLPEAQLQAMRALAAASNEKVEFAYVLDHLEEERARHITIDTAQRFFASPRRDYVIIDAPGHKEFLKNMITGAAQASAAIMMLDVTEGLREQTRRHAFMLHLLGIRQLIVLVNKLDCVGYSQDVYNEMAGQINQLFDQLSLDRLAVIPASALNGDNIVRRSEQMAWYTGPTVLEALDLLKAPLADESLPLRLPVQDVYHHDGRAIAVGRVAAGQLRVGQPVRIAPTGQSAKVATLEKFNETLTAAGAGESIGFTLDAPLALTRGMSLCGEAEPPKVASELTLKVFWMSPRPLLRGKPITLRLATQEVVCNVKAINNRIDSSNWQVLADDAEELRDTEVAEVVLQADAPVYYDSFRRIAETGRLVLMHPPHIVGGGIITE